MSRVRISSPAPRSFVGFAESSQVSNSELATVVVTLLVGSAGVVATLIAAFAGSYSAYLLSARREDAKHLEAQAAAGNRALFTLGQQLNRLVNIQNQFINPVRTDPARAINMRPVGPIDSEPLVVRVESIMFLLESGHADMLFRLTLEQDWYDTVEAVTQRRSQLHYDEVQPALNRAGIVEYATWPMEQILQALGPMLFSRVSRMTEDIIQSVDKVILSNSAIANELHAALKRQFPNTKFVEVYRRPPASRGRQDN